MLLRFIACLALAGSGALAGAAQDSALSLEEALARTVSRHPALKAEAAELAAVAARADRESLSPPLTLAGDLENLGGTGALGAVDSLEATVRIGRTIELGGKRAARRALGDANLQERQNLTAITRLELQYRTAIRFHEVLADQLRLDLARKRLAQAEALQREVETWVNAARNPESDLHAASIAVADARLGLEHAEHELASARLTLAAGWGDTATDFGLATGDLLPLPAVDSFEQLAADLLRSPDHLSAGLQAQTIAARRQLARTSATPDVQVSLGVRRLESFNEQALVMGFSMPLGSRTRAMHSIAEADAQSDVVAAHRDAAHIERHQALFETYQELVHARTETEALRDEMLPPARDALAFAQRGFTDGRLPFTTVAQAQKTLQELLERQTSAAARYHMLLARLQRFTAANQDTSP